jgi:hypothetical protein
LTLAWQPEFAQVIFSRFLRGEQLGDALDLVLDDGQETMLDPVGFVALFGRQIEWETEHGKSPP